MLEYLENPIEDIVPCIEEADDGGGMGADEIEAYEQRLRVVVKDLIRGTYCVLILEYTHIFRYAVAVWPFSVQATVVEPCVGESFEE